MHSPNRPSIDETLPACPRLLSGANKSAAPMTAYLAGPVSTPPEGHA